MQSTDAQKREALCFSSKDERVKKFQHLSPATILAPSQHKNVLTFTRGPHPNSLR